MRVLSSTSFLSHLHIGTSTRPYALREPSHLTPSRNDADNDGHREEDRNAEHMPAAEPLARGGGGIGGAGGGGGGGNAPGGVAAAAMGTVVVAMAVAEAAAARMEVAIRARAAEKAVAVVKAEP